MFHGNCKVIVNKQVSDDFYEIEIVVEDDVSAIIPGQFVQLKLIKEDGYLFRKPFSISDVCKENNSIRLLYKVVGKTTREMTCLKPDQLIDLISPLGMGFDIGEVENHILVGGGVGIAPLYLLAKRIKAIGGGKVIVFLGYRNKSQIVYEDEFNGVCDDLIITTDDGSFGSKGFVTDAVDTYLNQLTGSVMMYSCGPKPMMKLLQAIAETRQLACQLSLEEYMACGVGACLGCVVKIKKGDSEKYRRVCKDGPVFDSREVVF